MLALVDQGLIGTSNFIVGILLARQVSPAAYGAYAVAFECFLGLSIVYGSLVLEPMSVFGPSTYRESPREYLAILLRVHLATAVASVVILGGAAWIARSLARNTSLPGALAGTVVAVPCVLLFWLARRAFYVKLKPTAAAYGSVVYCIVLVFGLVVLQRFGLLSPFLTFGHGYSVIGAAQAEPWRIEAFDKRGGTPALDVWTLGVGKFHRIVGCQRYLLSAARLVSRPGTNGRSEGVAQLQWSPRAGDSRVFAALTPLCIPNSP
jgi:hypothetical protein